MNTTREERAWLRCLANEAFEGRAQETLLRALDDADAADATADDLDPITTTCPKCGCPPRAVRMAAHVDFAIEADGTLGRMQRANSPDPGTAVYVCGIGHKWGPASVPKGTKKALSADAANAKLLAKVRAMQPKTRAKFFRTADPATIEALTEPCTGEAHRNAHIDHCMVCLYCTWGRVLKAEPSAEVAPCNPAP